MIQRRHDSDDLSGPFALLDGPEFRESQGNEGLFRVAMQNGAPVIPEGSRKGGGQLLSGVQIAMQANRKILREGTVGHVVKSTRAKHMLLHLAPSM